MLTAGATLALLAAGGLVTSHGVGMSVPDWPNTYGYNMFLFPISQWVGGIFYEHTHRLLAAAIGLLTTVLAAWLWARETRGREKWLGLAAMVAVIVVMGVRRMPVYVALAACAPVAIGFSVWRIRVRPTELRWWGLVAFAAVILQGVLGGLRVVLIQDQIGILHAALAQLFFALTCALALLTSRRWAAAGDYEPAEWSGEAADRNVRAPGGFGMTRLRGLLLAATALIFVQLVIGAAMRHQHAGLAIPDFPLAYGKLWPATDSGSVALYNQRRLEVTAVNPITAFQVVLQMVHRLVAVSILAVVGYCAWLARRGLTGRPGELFDRVGKRRRTAALQDASRESWTTESRASVLECVGPLPLLPASDVAAGFPRWGTLIWLGLILAQVLLGAATIWSGKAADVATAHVLVGALSLATGTVLNLGARRGAFIEQPDGRPTAAPAAWRPPLLSSPAAAVGIK